MFADIFNNTHVWKLWSMEKYYFELNVIFVHLLMEKYEYDVIEIVRIYAWDMHEFCLRYVSYVLDNCLSYAGGMH